MNITHSLEASIQTFDLTVSRLRGIALRLRGIKGAVKLSVGRGCRFSNPDHISIGQRGQIEDHVYFKIASKGANCSIGEQVFIGKGVELNIEQSITIGDHVLIAPGVFIIDHNHQTSASLRINQQDCLKKPITIGNDVWIGANAVILPGVNIGDGAVIAAGAVVNKDAKTMSVVAGVPASKISERY